MEKPLPLETEKIDKKREKPTPFKSSGKLKSSVEITMERIKKEEKIVSNTELAKILEEHERQLGGIDVSVAKKLDEFNIGEKIKNIEGFDKLTKGQQLLVLENLKQLTLGRIQEEAAEKYKTNTVEAKFLGRIWQNITKNYQIAKLEKASAENIKKGGLEVHGETLRQLTKGIKELGSDAVEKNGKLEIRYAVGFKNLDKEEKTKVNYFNESANEFCRVPYEWSLETADKGQQKKYKETKERYEFSRNLILNLKKEKGGSEKDAALYMNDIDSKINYNRFLNNHPDVEKQLQEITDKNILARAFKNIATERGVYAAAGFIVRSATTSLIGLASVPIAAAGMGGLIAWKRAKKTLKEREIAARKGEKEKSEIAKNFVDADNLSEKIEYFIRRIDSESNEDEKAKLINSLKTRVEYTQDKLNDGLVNFGKSDIRLKNQLDLVQKISQADIFVIGLNKDGQFALKERLEKFLELKEKKISEAQKKYIRDVAVRGAVMGAGFAVAGYALRHFGEEWFNWVKGKEEVGGAVKVIKESSKIAPADGVDEEVKILKGEGVVPEKFIPEAAKETFLVSGFKVEAPKIPLEIGIRGPEGAISDYLKSQGMPGEKAGAEAHKMFLKYMNEHNIADQEEFMEKMRHIATGGIMITSDGKINLVDAKYLEISEPKIDYQIKEKIEIPELEIDYQIKEKINFLLDVGVSEDDIRELTNEDIKALTPDQLEDIAFEQKIMDLKSAGVSQADIDSLNKEDIKTLTHEQIENIKGERISFFKEAPEVAAAEEIDKGIAIAEGIKPTIINFDDGGSVKIDINPDGSGKARLEGDFRVPQDDINKHLSDNWMDEINKMKNKNISLAREIVYSRAREIEIYQRVLNKLESQGAGDSPEFNLIKDMTKFIVDKTEKIYGNVYKE